jgi:hypothetical protein
MMDRKEVIVQYADQSMEKCSIEIAKSAPWQIKFSGADFGLLEFEADDLFKAFVLLRERLEKTGCRLLCNGARVDVVTSGMSRQMGGGRKAYIVSLGSPARRKNIVDIFDYAEPNLIGSVDQQKQFYSEWVSSLNDE